MGGSSGAVFFPNETKDSTNDIGGGKLLRIGLSEFPPNSFDQGQ